MNQMWSSLLILILGIVLIMVGCSGKSDGSNDSPNDTSSGDADTDADSDSDSDSTVDGPVSISGSVQKGPLIQGSSLTVAILEADGTPTGVNYNTTTSSNLGDFSVTALVKGPAELIGEGYYFNEITNSLSTAPITLRAIYEVSEDGEQQAYLNVFTHMSSGLAMKGLANGTVNEAVVQAENTLFMELGILHPLGALQANGTAMDLTGVDSPDNQYIMAVSCIVAKAAEMRTEGNYADLAARLQELLNDIRNQLQTSDKISDEYKGYLQEAEAAMNPMTECVANLAAYLEDKTGVPPTLPDPNQAADKDHDGVVNALDPDVDGDSVLNEDDIDEWDSTVLGWVWTDVETGLVWVNMDMEGENPLLNWQDAVDFCENLVHEGEGPGVWQLPSIEQLESLRRTEPTSVECFWPATLSGPCHLESFWSSTSFADDASKAHSAYFGSSGTLADEDKTIERLVRCVHEVI